MEISKEQLETIEKAFNALSEILDGFTWITEIQKHTGLPEKDCQEIVQVNQKAQALLKILKNVNIVPHKPLQTPRRRLTVV